MIITDDQIRAACKIYGLNPVGHVPVQGYEVDLDPAHRKDWTDEACYELAAKVVDGETWPAAGLLGFAAGYPSPGWQFLRNLCDRVTGNDIGADWFEALTYDDARLHLQEYATERAKDCTWQYALVCVADLGANEGTEDASVYLADLAEPGRPQLSRLAGDLLGYVGYLVLREVFAPQIDSKPKR